MEEKKFTITLTEDQAEIILGLIDDHTIDKPDFLLNEEGRVFTPMLDPNFKDYNVSLQDHLDLFLDRNELEY